MTDLPPGPAIVTQTYKGSLENANKLYAAHAQQMAADGYFPVGQVYTPGSWGCGAFLVALLLCIVVIGIVVFIYMVLVKPDGTLVVTYERRAVAPG